MFQDRDELRRAIADWTRSILDLPQIRHNQAELARISGVSKSTISRMLGTDKNFDGLPGFFSISAVANAVGRPLPAAASELPDRPLQQPSLQSHQGAFREDDVQPLQPPANEPWNPNLQHWEIKNLSLQLAGFLPGDRIVADASLLPHVKAGDIVIAQIPNRQGGARTVIRRYKPPYILTAGTDPDRQEITTVDGEQAYLMAVFIRLIRQRAA